MKFAMIVTFLLAVFVPAWGQPEPKHQAPISTPDLIVANSKQQNLVTLLVSARYSTLAQEESVAWSRNSNDSKKEKRKKYVQLAGIILAVPGAYLYFHEDEDFGEIMFIAGAILVLGAELL